MKHETAGSNHYDQEAKHYDVFNEEKSKLINKTIEKALVNHGIKTILDLTCGTGSQVFWLHDKGFEVVGYDINRSMLEIAKEKAKQKLVDIKFLEGDMRTIKAGCFDAVLTIFNSIGHLTKEDFEITVQNVHNNLTLNGIYVFDIFNLNYLLEGDNITKLTIDWLKKYKNCIAREIQYSTINQEGILASYDIYHEEVMGEKPKISQAYQTLQVYSKKQLIEILSKYRFKVLKQVNINGNRCYDKRTERILTVAQKV